ncbi:MAG: hypothetical protein COC24_002100 [Alphaproteobacteria bacterium]|nr:hypothetical protein [Alphaproteobacteria bacterium]
MTMPDPALFALLASSAIGFVAGTILLTSSFSMLLGNLKNPIAGDKASRLGRFLMGLGNALWVMSALVSGTYILVAMATINAIIHFEIWRRMTAKFKKHGNDGDNS